MDLPFFQVGERGVSWVKKHHKGSLRCASSSVMCTRTVWIFWNSGCDPFFKGTLEESNLESFTTFNGS